MKQDLKKGTTVRIKPGPRALSAVLALRGQLATVVSWSQAENCYRVRLEDGTTPIIYRGHLEPVTP